MIASTHFAGRSEGFKGSAHIYTHQFLTQCLWLSRSETENQWETLTRISRWRRSRGPRRWPETQIWLEGLGNTRGRRCTTSEGFGLSRPKTAALSLATTRNPRLTSLLWSRLSFTPPMMSRNHSSTSASPNPQSSGAYLSVFLYLSLWICVHLCIYQCLSMGFFDCVMLLGLVWFFCNVVKWFKWMP